MTLTSYQLSGPVRPPHTVDWLNALVFEQIDAEELPFADPRSCDGVPTLFMTLARPRSALAAISRIVKSTASFIGRRRAPPMTIGSHSATFSHPAQFPNKNGLVLLDQVRTFDQ
jgi:hypothetical protein